MNICLSNYAPSWPHIMTCSIFTTTTTTTATHYYICVVQRMNHVVLSLPIDHITRSWCTVVSDSRAKLKQSLSNDDLGVDNAVKSNYTIKEENEQQLKLLAKQTLSGEEDDDDKEEDGENKEMSLTSSTSTGNVQGDVQAGEVESLTQEIKQVKLDMNDIISLLNKSIKDNNDQLEELKGMIQSVVLSLSSTWTYHSLYNNHYYYDYYYCSEMILNAIGTTPTNNNIIWNLEQFGVELVGVWWI